MSQICPKCNEILEDSCIVCPHCYEIIKNETTDNVTSPNEPIYISSASEDEEAETYLYWTAKSIRIFGLIVALLYLVSGTIINVQIAGFSIILFIINIIIAAIIYIIIGITGVIIKVLANISMSLKDITKLLNK